MTELKRRMINDMKLAALVPDSQKAYLDAVQRLAAHFRLSPDQLTEDQVGGYLIHLRDVRNFARGTFSKHFFALKFLFVKTLAYDWALFTKKKFARPNRSVFPTFVVPSTVAA